MKFLIIILLAAVCAAELPSSYFPSSHYETSSNNHFGRTEITKDIYVHLPPPDSPEEFEGNSGKPIVNKKNYKIIFIKAPSVDTAQMARLQQQAQIEEKTIVYVLSKKPEQNTELEAQKNSNNKSHKPEVYFIKYKAQKQKHGHIDANAPYA